MAHIAEGRLCHPVGPVGRLAAQIAIVTGDGVVATVRTDLPHPLVADLTRLLFITTAVQFLNPVHQIVGVLMVGQGKEGVPVSGLQLEILLLHRGDDRVIAQLTIDVHLRLIVVT